MWPIARNQPHTAYGLRVGQAWFRDSGLNLYVHSLLCINSEHKRQSNIGMLGSLGTSDSHPGADFSSRISEKDKCNFVMDCDGALDLC